MRIGIIGTGRMESGLEQPRTVLLAGDMGFEPWNGGGLRSAHALRRV